MCTEEAKPDLEWLGWQAVRRWAGEGQWWASMKEPWRCCLMPTSLEGGTCRGAARAGVGACCPPLTCSTWPSPNSATSQVGAASCHLAWAPSRCMSVALCCDQWLTSVSLSLIQLAVHKIRIVLVEFMDEALLLPCHARCCCFYILQCTFARPRSRTTTSVLPAALKLYHEPDVPNLNSVLHCLQACPPPRHCCRLQMLASLAPAMDCQYKPLHCNVLQCR